MITVVKILKNFLSYILEKYAKGTFRKLRHFKVRTLRKEKVII